APFVREYYLAAVIAERGRVPVGEIRICNGTDAHRVGRVADIEQKSVSLARTASQPDFRIYGNVVALGWAGARTVATEDARHQRWKCLTKRCAVAGRWSAGTVACLDDAVQHGLRDSRVQHTRGTVYFHDERAGCTRLGNACAVCGRVCRCIAVARRGFQVVENARRADDCSSSGVGERNLDYLDAEERRVRVLARHSGFAAFQLIG